MKDLSPEEFGKTLVPPLSRSQAWHLCREGRIEGAYVEGGRWKIPVDARIEGAGVRARRSDLSGISVAEFAQKAGVSRQAVYRRIKTGDLEAIKTENGWEVGRRARWAWATPGGRGE